MLFFFFSETRVMKKKAPLCLQVQQFFDFSLLTNSSRAISIASFLNVKIVDVGYINAYSSLFSFASSCSIFSRRNINQTDAPMAKGSKMYWMISSFDRGVGGISGRGTCVDCVD